MKAIQQSVNKNTNCNLCSYVPWCCSTCMLLLWHQVLRSTYECLMNLKKTSYLWVWNSSS